MAGSTTKRTTDHATIRRWAEQRGASPASVRGHGPGHEASGLRLDMPGLRAVWLEEITWDEFFRRFEERGLEFLYQDTTREGEPSSFFKLINRSTPSQTKAA